MVINNVVCKPSRSFHPPSCPPVFPPFRPICPCLSARLPSLPTRVFSRLTNYARSEFYRKLPRHSVKSTEELLRQAHAVSVTREEAEMKE
ncbi:hypothetical protein E2C01_017627 [Portunus trituberculatus]|uniref:Uncharacterized protein n=1 Tax=Portunus trituberculatus TaxID=210409 RepID=A0A5B7DU17_PORTR|nr:hypothetical protein [Portunus trituberculatus]